MNKVAAMILCAGFGTRLGELTKACPKPMLEISGYPLLYYIIMNLKRVGITQIFINLHYLSDQITSYFGDGKKFGLQIEYSYEDSPLGTAGALVPLKHKLTNFENIFCIYGDILTNQNLIDVLHFHKSSKALLTFVSHERQKSNSIALSNKKGKVIKFLERPSNEEVEKLKIAPPFQVNSAIYCMDREVLNHIPSNKVVDFPKNIFPALIKKDGLFSFPLEGHRLAIDGSDRLQQAREKLGKFKSLNEYWELNGQ
ncbi:nucleotidyltransferase family protein [Bacteriovoracales bacterium]|nr:nucleotidyltransferase family protein [Bacteriovoracales bacterium]